MSWRRGKSYSQDFARTCPGRDRWWHAGLPSRTVVSGQRVLHLQSLGPATCNRRDHRRPQRCHLAWKLEPYHQAIRDRVSSQPDATLDELRAWMLTNNGISVSQGKKRHHAAEQGRPDIAQARATWRREQPAMNAARLVFIDETWATTNMTRRYGRARRGQRVIASVPHGHWKTSTFFAGSIRSRSAIRLHHGGLPMARTCCCSAHRGVGKTHLSIALGREAILAGYTVQFTTIQAGQQSNHPAEQSAERPDKIAAVHTT